METYYVMVAEPHYLLRIDEAEEPGSSTPRSTRTSTSSCPRSSDILKDSEIGQD